ncbi:MAG: response regulator transcription factor [Chloroflexi bacterium]|nr:response regulator transcription factor [Chloroflexota bacterium]
MSTWMVVEDEPDIYDVLLAMFEIWGIEGVAFVDGAEAVAWIEDVDQGRVRGDLPELAILDIRLPEISGPEVGSRLRQSPILGDIAIVLITAYRLSPEEEEAVVAQAQADLLMYKPLPAMAELRTTMDNVIAKHKKEQAPKPGPKPAAAANQPPVPQQPAPKQVTSKPNPPVAKKPKSKPAADKPNVKQSSSDSNQAG